MTASAGRMVAAEAHDLGDRSAVADHLEDLRGDERDRFGMIQLQAARPALARELAGGKNQQLVDFARGEMHGRSLESGNHTAARRSALNSAVQD